MSLLNGDVSPSPMFAGGLLFVVEPDVHLTALRPGGGWSGPVPQVVWRYEEGIPDVPTPVSDGERLFVLSSTGKLSCLRLADGHLLWKDRQRGLYRTSPAIADGVLHITNDRGKTVFYAAADERRELGREELGEPCVTSPAFVDGRIYLRGTNHLFCIAAGSSGGGEP